MTSSTPHNRAMAKSAKEQRASQVGGSFYAAKERCTSSSHGRGAHSQWSQGDITIFPRALTKHHRLHDDEVAHERAAHTTSPLVVAAHVRRHEQRGPAKRTRTRALAQLLQVRARLRVNPADIVEVLAPSSEYRRHVEACRATTVVRVSARLTRRRALASAARRLELACHTTAAAHSRARRALLHRDAAAAGAANSPSRNVSGM